MKAVIGRFFAEVGSPGSIVMKIHAADTANSDNAGAEVVTLSGSYPDTAGLHTFTCSGASCPLSATTTYFHDLLRGDVNGRHQRNGLYGLARTTSDEESAHPSGNGWSIADLGRYKTGTDAWASLAGHTGRPHIAADD